jgi:tetratricopeptide (TPR) repeat protein
MPIDASEERLSKYELIRPLGSGGWGEVYLARDRVLQRQVAIKFVSSARLADPDAERRLVREARAAAALDHPAICSVYDVLTEKGRTCIVMQYVDGETLAERLKRGPLEPTEAVTLASRIAEGLAAAHAAGIVHRDLKPQNIMLLHDGRPKLLDFGIAQTQLPPDVVASIETHTATEVLHAGAVVGTPGYMSPEQVLRKSVDGRSDLFSLGAVLYECLTGQPAFLASTDVDTWARVVYVVPPAPSSINRAVTPRIDAIVAKLLAKEPAERFASAVDAVAALRALGMDRRPGRYSRRQLIAAVTAVVVAVALVGFAAWRVTRPRPIPPAPPEAKRWYDLGTEYLRGGAYYSAGVAFNEALHVLPEYPQALVRLAESLEELDNEQDAREAIIRATEMVSNPARLPLDDAARMAAVHALLARDLSRATAEYRGIINRNARDAGTWLDLARVQAQGGLLADASASCAQALKIDRDDAAAHLRLGRVAGLALRRDEALAQSAEAERLYRAASNIEGETEAVFQRAQFLNAIGDFAAVREPLEAAAALADRSGNQYQQLRARLLRSSVTSFRGDFEGARQMAQGAVDAALTQGFTTVAADGLIEFGTTLMLLRQYDAARAEFDRGIALARRADAKVVVARASLQFASLYLDIGQPRDAANLTNGVLDFLHRGGYRRYEMLALSILSRAHQGLNEYEEAAQLSREVLSKAESLHDEREVATTLGDLADQAAFVGAVPEALALQSRQEAVHLSTQDTSAVPFDLTNRAEFLIRLGRMEEAASALDETDAHIKSGDKAYTGRRLKVIQLRSLMAAETGQFMTAAALARDVFAANPPETSTNRYWAAALLAYADARLTQPRGPDVAVPRSGLGTRAFQREFRYWRTLSLLYLGDASIALQESKSALAGIARAPSADYEWRMAAIASEAARRTGDLAGAQTWQAQSRTALNRLRDEWKDAVKPYERRADVIDLKRAIGVD